MKLFQNDAYIKNKKNSHGENLTGIFFYTTNNLLQTCSSNEMIWMRSRKAK